MKATVIPDRSYSCVRCFHLSSSGIVGKHPTAAIPTMFSNIFTLGLLAMVLKCAEPTVLAKDQLVSVEADFAKGQLQKSYRELWQQKLFPKRDAVAKFLLLPGSIGTEIGITIYQRAGNGSGEQPQFGLIVKKPSSALWGNVITQVSIDKKPTRITIKTCEVSLPESTAKAVHGAWLAMLMKLEQPPDELIIDSSREIFFAKNSQGQELRGRLPLSKLGAKTTTLFEMANLLYFCCDKSEVERTNDFRRIETLAKNVADSKRGPR